MTLRPTFYPKNTVKRLAASLLSKKYHFIGDGYMRNKIKYLWRSHSMLIIVCGGLLGIFTIPWLFTRDWFASFASYTNLGQIGDTIGGTTAPFIGLLSAVLVYRALQAQIKANEIIQKQIEKQEQESVERQKHESFMKMYEAYVRVLGEVKSAPQKLVDWSPVARMAHFLLKSELEKEGTQRWENIRFFRAQLSKDELNSMAVICMYDDEGRAGLRFTAKKTGLFKDLKNKQLIDALKVFSDSEGFFNLEVTENEYKDKSVKI
jgi:hypothetical protein